MTQYRYPLVRARRYGLDAFAARGRTGARGGSEVLELLASAESRQDLARRLEEEYDLELLERLRDAVSLPIIASGCAGTAAHVAAALGISQAALLASILHEQPARLVTLRSELRALGVPLRDAA